MGSLGDTLAALKNVILLHERVDDVRKECERQAADLKGLGEYAVRLDNRLSRLEGFIDGATAASAAAQRRLTE